MKYKIFNFKVDKTNSVSFESNVSLFLYKKFKITKNR